MDFRCLHFFDPGALANYSDFLEFDDAAIVSPKPKALFGSIFRMPCSNSMLAFLGGMAIPLIQVSWHGRARRMISLQLQLG
jgi:hypothetical protein